jgi:hypothetical protein
VKPAIERLEDHIAYLIETRDRELIEMRAELGVLQSTLATIRQLIEQDANKQEGLK